MFSLLDNCMICPKECGVNRNSGQTGYCGYDSGYHIGSIVMHHGEEPPVSGKNGICNIFFRGCNLRCSYCQNFQISRRNRDTNPLSLDVVIRRVTDCILEGAEAVGFVSPSHFIPHVRQIILEIQKRGYKPVTVFNTNAYDKAEVLHSLEGLIDVYLPDFKYLSTDSAHLYSGAADYPDRAKEALREMYRQKGSSVILSETGQAVTGLIIRHLVLPGHADDSIQILNWIASELSPSVHVSLMSQYHPTSCVIDDPLLGRTVNHDEYLRVLEAMEHLGFYRGWIQDYDSHSNYLPDFESDRPFK